MRLSELSERSGVPSATIKYYLREGLLPPGRRLSATRSDYSEGHLSRLGLIRALVHVGRVPVTTAREVLAAIDDDALDHHMRLGAAVWAIPYSEGSDGTDPVTKAARTTADALLERLGWTFGREAGPESPAYRMLVEAIGSMRRLGYPCDVTELLPYARCAGEVATADLDLIERYEHEEEQVEAAVAFTVLYEPVLLSLRKLAQAEESYRRYT